MRGRATRTSSASALARSPWAARSRRSRRTSPAPTTTRPRRPPRAGFSYADYNLEFRSQTGRYDHDASRITPLSAITLGIAASLSREPDEFLSRVAVSLGLFAPTRVIVGAEVETSPGTPQYFLYGERRDKLGVMPAVAFRILPLDPEGTQTLALGFGATILADVGGEFTFDLSTTAARSVAADLKLHHDVAPNVGLFYWPVPWLSIGLAYRGQLSLKAEFDVQIVVDGTNLFPLELEAVTLYQPQQLAGGVAIDPLDWLTLALDVTWSNWSAYEDPFVTIRPIIPQADVEFEDIFVPRVGVEIEPLLGLALRTGYYYQASPLPSQAGSTNLVDLDKHVVSFGLGWTYWTTRSRVGRSGEEAIVEETVSPFTFDAFFQWHHLLEERVEKDTASSPQTGSFYEAEGEIYNFGLQMTFRL